MAEKNMKQGNRNAVIIWVGLLAALLYSSNALIPAFSSFSQTISQRLGTYGGSLFSDRPSAMIFFLGLVMVLLLINAWRNLVSMMFEMTLAFSGKLEETVFESLLNYSADEDDSLPTRSLPSSVLRDLTLVWGLFFLIFLMLPIILTF